MGFPIVPKPSFLWNWSPQIWVKPGFAVERGEGKGMLSFTCPYASECPGCLPDWMVLHSHWHAPFTLHSLPGSLRGIKVLWSLWELLNCCALLFRSSATAGEEEFLLPFKIFLARLRSNWHETDYRGKLNLVFTGNSHIRGHSKDRQNEVYMSF